MSLLAIDELQICRPARIRCCRMKRSIIIAVALLFSAQNLLGADNDSAVQLLTSAELQGNLFRDSRSPVRLEVSFVAQQTVPTQGHLSLRWAAKDRWWRKVSLSDFQQIEIRNGEKLYTTRNLPFTPVRVGELISLLQFADDPRSGSFAVRKPKRRIESGKDVICMQVKDDEDRDQAREFCIDSASHDILTVDWKEPPDELRREQFADYFRVRFSPLSAKT